MVLPDMTDPLAPTDNQSQPSSPRKKERLTINLAPDLIERARDVAYYSPSLTLAGLVELALEEFIAWLERARSEPFPRRPGPLKTGRPLR